MDEMEYAYKFTEAENTAVQSLTNIIQEIAKADIWQQLAETTKACAKGMQQFINATYKLVLTPKQYHLMCYGKTRIRKKWLNVARKKFSKFC